MFRFCFLLLTGSLLATSPSADPITGAVRAIDGDTIDVGAYRVRLFGIDAPERLQICHVAGQPWTCGEWSRSHLITRFEGQIAQCDLIDVDRRGRRVARCFVAGQDMADILVREGAALAFRKYSLDYVDTEKRAMFAETGIWKSEFETPAEFRASVRTPDHIPNPDCPIKGNISVSGKIFHLPGQSFYDETRINPNAGERWFCDRQEALSAGWRPARR